MGNERDGGLFLPEPGRQFTIEASRALAKLGAIYAFGVPALDVAGDSTKNRLSPPPPLREPDRVLAKQPLTPS
jgi:hypothetical protein